MDRIGDPLRHMLLTGYNSDMGEGKEEAVIVIIIKSTLFQSKS